MICFPLVTFEELAKNKKLNLLWLFTSQEGLPDFPWCKLPKREITLQVSIKNNKMAVKIPNGHKSHKHLLLPDTPKFTQNGNFGLEIYHLATLVTRRQRS
jgi:hypothetical protein